MGDVVTDWTSGIEFRATEMIRAGMLVELDPVRQVARPARMDAMRPDLAYRVAECDCPVGGVVRAVPIHDGVRVRDGERYPVTPFTPYRVTRWPDGDDLIVPADGGRSWWREPVVVPRIAIGVVLTVLTVLTGMVVGVLIAVVY